ncbi:Crp/Fnr family transcriptional regulator [Paraflavitalea soli]|uniref:Crp/Fnr family transcriptional regulator n=1 Tax=Paraflavitalea soli TaxID=2315862 RepID=A0A3B7MVN2_9BACT|nr:Crp/Fnr family transcriptional regulator [Paraflavitalea soli]AXY78534.1 Crp/Fnr family transcriptional regulator [Paraflavitalea soli]
MKETHDCDLKTCFLCSQSLDGWLPLIASNRKNLHFKKGEVIFEEGKAVEGIYFLFDGIVKVHKAWGKEKELILHFAKKGDMIGYRGLGNKKTYPVTATALEPVTVCFIDLVFFESTLQVNHQLTYHLLKFYTNELQEAENRMRNLAHMDVKGRIAESLLVLKKRFGQGKDGYIKITVSRQDMASFAGTTYETLFRTMNELVNDKLIRITGKQIAILKEAALEALSANKELD